MFTEMKALADQVVITMEDLKRLVKEVPVIEKYFCVMAKDIPEPFIYSVQYFMRGRACPVMDGELGYWLVDWREWLRHEATRIVRESKSQQEQTTPSMMKIFLRTEYTDFIDSQLLSIGMVSEDGMHELYLEVADYDVTACNELVLESIVPMLGQGTQVTKANLKATLEAWFATLPSPVQLACDRQIDIDLLRSALAGDLPANVERRLFDLREAMEAASFKAAVRQYHSQGNPLYHALHDVRAHRMGWLAWIAQQNRQTSHDAIS